MAPSCSKSPRSLHSISHVGPSNSCGAPQYRAEKAGKRYPSLSRISYSHALLTSSPFAETKSKRAAIARQQRADERKAKRHSKAQAKRERKLNITRSAKWTEERRAEMKAKKLANKPQKMERKRLRLLSRKKKLEIQAHRLLAEAKKSGELYEAMTRVKQVRPSQECLPSTKPNRTLPLTSRRP